MTEGLLFPGLSPGSVLCLGPTLTSGSFSAGLAAPRLAPSLCRAGGQELAPACAPACAGAGPASPLPSLSPPLLTVQGVLLGAQL